MNILMKKDILPESEARFYIAETIAAIESIHKLNYIHRDIKPDNILIDKYGHVKLSDFGLCKHAQVIEKYNKIKKLNDEDFRKLASKSIEFKRNRVLAFSTVGTPDYIAPEVFGKSGYNEAVDWWSVGVIFYEMVVGYPPFYADEPSLTCQKILHWRKTLHIPKQAGLSKEASDLIKKLICDPEDRLGSRGVEEIKAHTFFRGLDWNRLRDIQPPWVPLITSDTDTSNFDKFEEAQPLYLPDPKKKAKKDSEFIGYTFKKDEENQRINLLNALKELDVVRKSGTRKTSAPVKCYQHNSNIY